jgi:ferredoxin-nitrite reductase
MNTAEAGRTVTAMNPPAKTEPSLTEINGEKLTSEQQSYLSGWFAGLRDRGFGFSDVATTAAAATPAPGAADLSSLILEERVKKELHPLDAYPLLLEHASTQQAPDRENTFRFKWHGLFYLTPVKEAFMARLRVPGGVLRGFQLREIARIAKELTSGYIQITTRANLQIRLIQVKDTPEFLRQIQHTGLHTRGAGADNIRNLTASPTSGLDPYELIETIPIAQQLGQIIIHDREFYNLPRKFNVAFDGGGLVSSVEETNDIGVKAVRLEREAEGLAPGVYFRVKLGGATGHKAIAADLGVLVPPAQILKVVEALIRVYVANGNRTDRKKARLKHLLESWSLDRYLAETESLLGTKLLRRPFDPAEQTTTLFVGNAQHAHIGIYPQKQKGLCYIGVALPVGQITAKQLAQLADLADNYGAGEVRLTVWQNLILPGIRSEDVERVKKALVKMGFDWKQSNLRSGVVACTGNSYCKFSSTNTKAHALDLAAYLEKRFNLDQPVNIHLTGCPNSCAQHYIGDIGLLGTRIKAGADASIEGYHVFVGGGFGDNKAIGRQIFQGITLGDLKPTLERMIQGYLRRRQPGESFQKFTLRHDLNNLQAIFTNEE